MTDRSQTEALAKSFATLTEVHAYLVDQGWRVARRTVYLHEKKGMLQRAPSGAFERAAVDKYARLHLKEAATGRKATDRGALLQERRLTEEIGRIRAQRIRAEHEIDILKGKYISKLDHEADLIAQAHGIVNYLSKIKHTLPARLVEAARGDASRVHAVHVLLAEAIDAILNEYATTRTHTVRLEDASQVQ